MDIPHSAKTKFVQGCIECGYNTHQAARFTDILMQHPDDTHRICFDGVHKKLTCNIHCFFCLRAMTKSVPEEDNKTRIRLSDVIAVTTVGFTRFGYTQSANGDCC